MLKQRVITALILLPIMLGMLFWVSDGLWAAFSGLIAVLALWEYSRMCGIGDKERVPYLASSALFMLLAACGGWVLPPIGWCRCWLLTVRYGRVVNSSEDIQTLIVYKKATFISIL